jgi:hypothetical protein
MDELALTERCDSPMGPVLIVVVIVAVAVIVTLVVAWLHGGKIPRM